VCSTAEFRMWMPSCSSSLPGLVLVFVDFYLHNKNWAIFFKIGPGSYKYLVFIIEILIFTNTKIRSLFVLSPLLSFKFKVRLMSGV
jgi:hypothetical protein